MPKKLRPLTPYNSWNRKYCASTSRTRRTQKPPKSKAFLRDLKGKITKKRGTPTSCVISKSNLGKKHLQILPTRIPRKGSKITKKDKWERHNQALRNQAESSIHTMEVHTRSSLPPDHPSLSQDLSMKFSS
jgi:hypothetical protein